MLNNIVRMQYAIIIILVLLLSSCGSNYIKAPMVQGNANIDSSSDITLIVTSGLQQIKKFSGSR